MTSTNDGKDVKSNQSSGQKGKTYYIELYKSLEAGLSSESGLLLRTQHLCSAWRRVHALCRHALPATHPHLLSWLQRHTAKTILQTEWQSPKSKEQQTSLEEAIDDFIAECDTGTASKDGVRPPWETQLRLRGEWFKRILGNPWGHPVLRALLDTQGAKPGDDEILEWLKEERGVMFVTRLRQLAASKCDDLATALVSAVMDRARAAARGPDSEAVEPTVKAAPSSDNPSFEDILKTEAGFTVDVWELLTDIEFVLLHKGDRHSKCIELAKQTPLRDGYMLVDRLQSRLETSPREKKLWKNAKDVATLVAQVIIARCMVIPVCAHVTRLALMCCARSLVRLLPAARLPAAAAALAAPAASARHLHALAQAVDQQLHAAKCTDMKPFVCELYVRAITAGMNELERHKLKTEKESEARSLEQTLCGWFMQLGSLLSASARVQCECTLTAFSVHPAPEMYEKIRLAPPLPPVALDPEDIKEETTSEFGSWTSDSRTQSNLVKTSETLNMKHTRNRANVLSTAIFTEGEAIGLSPELCQDLAVLLSGPRVKTLSWDMDREVLLENCRTYMERTHGGTRALTTELKYLNLDPASYMHLPEEDDGEENDLYYGIEKGYEHLVEIPEPEEAWQDTERTESACSSSMEMEVLPVRRKKKTKRTPVSSEEDSNPLSLIAEVKRSEKKKERPHSKERSNKPRSKERKKKPKANEDSERKEGSRERRKDDTEDKEKKKEKKQRKKKIKEEQNIGMKPCSLSSLIGMKVAKIIPEGKLKKSNTETKFPLCITDSDYDSQGKSSLASLNSEGNDPDVLFDGLFTMDDYRSPESDPLADRNTLSNSELSVSNGKVAFNSQRPEVFNTPKKPEMVRTIKRENNMHSVIGQQVQNNQVRPAPVLNNANVPFDDVNTPNNINKVSEEVKKSITKLIEFRRQKSLLEESQWRSSMPSPCSTASSPRVNSDLSPTPSYKAPSAIRRSDYPDPPLITSPKALVVPEIPKVYINKKQTEHIRDLKQEVDNLITSNYTNPVIQYANRAMAPSPLSHTEEYIKQVLREQSEQQRALYQQPFQSILQTKQETAPQTSIPDFVKELQESINAGTGTKKTNAASKKQQAKKEIRPQRVSPIIKDLRFEPGTSSQCAKSTIQTTKKVDNHLNTFSRLSYMHKVKQYDNIKQYENAKFNKSVDSLINYQDQMLHKTIDEQKAAKLKVLQCKGDVVISRVGQTPQNLSIKDEAKVLIRKVEKPNYVKEQHPMLTNMLQTGAVAKKLPKQENHTRMTHQIERPKPPVILMSRSTTPAPRAMTPAPAVKESALSEKDQNDLLLLLRQQNKLNNPAYVDMDNRQINNQHYSNPTTSSASSHTQIPTAHRTVIKNYPTEIKNNNTQDYTCISKVAPIESVQNTYNKTTESKVGHVFKSATPKKLYTPSNVATNNAEVKSSCFNRSSVAHEPEPKREEWENVLDALLKHKTPSRGPNALDMALKKDSFVNSSLRNQRIIRTNLVLDSNKDGTSQPQKQIVAKHVMPTVIHKKPSSAHLASTESTLKKQNPAPIFKGHIHQQIKTQVPTNTNPQINTQVSTATHTQIKTQVPTATNQQIKTQVPTATNQQIKTQVPTATNQQMKTQVLTATNQQIKTQVPTATNQQMKTQVLTASNQLIKTQVPTASNQQIKIQVPTATNQQMKNQVPTATNQQIKNQIPTATNQQIKTQVTIVEPKRQIEIQKKIVIGDVIKEIIPGIPNSDYDLLDELMDDELRQEIGELSSDEDTYRSPANFAQGAKVSTKCTNINKHSVPQPEKFQAMDLRCGLKSSQDTRQNIAQTNKPVKCHATKTVIDYRTQQDQDKNVTKVEPKVYRQPETNYQCNVKPTKVIQPIMSVDHSQTNDQAFTVPQNMNTSHINIVEPRNVIITAQPVVPNVVLVGSDLMYDPFAAQIPTALCNVSQNPFVLNSTPNITVYQTTQFTAPVVNEVIIGNMAMPMQATATPMSCNESQQIPISQHNLTPPQDSFNTQINFSDDQVDDNLSSAQDCLNHLLKNKQINVSNVSVECQTMHDDDDEDVDFEMNQQIIDVHANIQTDPICESLPQNIELGINLPDEIDSKMTLDINCNKNGERKVLSEVQEITNIADKIERNITRDQKLHESNEEKPLPEIKTKREPELLGNVAIKDLERIMNKRLAIVNRVVSHRSYADAIPLGYAPLSKAKKSPINILPCPKSDNELSAKIATSNVLNNSKVINREQDTDSKENESKEIPARRILLRSSNDLKAMTVSSSPQDQRNPVGRKTKVRLKKAEANNESGDKPKSREDVSSINETPNTEHTPVVEAKSAYENLNKKSETKIAQPKSVVNIVDVKNNADKDAPKRVSMRILERKAVKKAIQKDVIEAEPVIVQPVHKKKNNKKQKVVQDIEKPEHIDQIPDKDETNINTDVGTTDTVEKEIPIETPDVSDFGLIDIEEALLGSKIPKMNVLTEEQPVSMSDTEICDSQKVISQSPILAQTNDSTDSVTSLDSIASVASESTEKSNEAIKTTQSELNTNLENKIPLTLDTPNETKTITRATLMTDKTVDDDKLVDLESLKIGKLTPAIVSTDANTMPNKIVITSEKPGLIEIDSTPAIDTSTSSNKSVVPLTQASTVLQTKIVTRSEPATVNANNSILSDAPKTNYLPTINIVQNKIVLDAKSPTVDKPNTDYNTKRTEFDDKISPTIDLDAIIKRTDQSVTKEAEKQETRSVTKNISVSKIDKSDEPKPAQKIMFNNITDLQALDVIKDKNGTNKVPTANPNRNRSLLKDRAVLFGDNTSNSVTLINSSESISTKNNALSNEESIDSIVQNKQVLPNVRTQISNSVDQGAKSPQMSQSTFESLKDKITIEELPPPPGNTGNKCVRIKLPNGKTFKATVIGKMHVSFESLFSDPSLRAALLNNMNDTKRYTVNIKQVSTTPKNDPSRIVDSRIEEVQIQSKQLEPIETVDLLSDDDDEPPSQNKNGNNTLKTEFGEFKSSLNQDDFQKHEKKLQMKPIIKLTDLKLHSAKREQVDLQISVSNQPVIKYTDEKSNTVHNTLTKPCISLQANTLDKDADKTSETNVIRNVSDIIEIDDSSNDSIENIIQSCTNKMLCDKITLEEQIREGLTMSPKKIENSENNPADDIDELKNLLLQDLGVNLVNDAVEPEKNDTNADSLSNSNESNVKLRKCFVKLQNCDDLLEKYEQIRIRNQKCTVNLYRCDETVSYVASDEELNLPDDFLEIDAEPRLNRSGSFSLLDELNIDDDKVDNSTKTDDRSSPVMEVFEMITRLRKPIQGKEESLSVMEAFGIIASLRKPALTKLEDTETINCFSDWCTTKSELHASNKNELLGIKSNINDIPLFYESTFNSATDKQPDVVPTLKTLTAKLFRNDDILNQLKPYYMQSPSHKLKRKIIIGEDACVGSKLLKVMIEKHDHKIDEQLSVSLTDLITLKKNTTNLQTENKDIGEPDKLEEQSVNIVDTPTMDIEPKTNVGAKEINTPKENIQDETSTKEVEVTNRDENSKQNLETIDSSPKYNAEVIVSGDTNKTTTEQNILIAAEASTCTVKQQDDSAGKNMNDFNDVKGYTDVSSETSLTDKKIDSDTIKNIETDTAPTIDVNKTDIIEDFNSENDAHCENSLEVTTCIEAVATVSDVTENELKLNCENQFTTALKDEKETASLQEVDKLENIDESDTDKIKANTTDKTENFESHDTRHTFSTHGTENKTQENTDFLNKQSKVFDAVDDTWEDKKVTETEEDTSRKDAITNVTEVISECSGDINLDHNEILTLDVNESIANTSNTSESIIGTEDPLLAVAESDYIEENIVECKPCNLSITENVNNDTVEHTHDSEAKNKVGFPECETVNIVDSSICVSNNLEIQNENENSANTSETDAVITELEDQEKPAIHTSHAGIELVTVVEVEADYDGTLDNSSDGCENCTENRGMSERNSENEHDLTLDSSNRQITNLTEELTPDLNDKTTPKIDFTENEQEDISHDDIDFVETVIVIGDEFDESDISLNNLKYDGITIPVTETPAIEPEEKCIDNESNIFKESDEIQLHSTADVLEHGYAAKDLCLEDSVEDIKNVSARSESSELKAPQVGNKAKFDKEFILSGIEYDDPEGGTCYVFPIAEPTSSSCDNYEMYEETEEIIQVIQEIGEDGTVGNVTVETKEVVSEDAYLKLTLPKQTYSKYTTCKYFTRSNQNKKSLKRKSDMSDIRISEKKYRKSKNIDHPKAISRAAILETTYFTEFEQVMDYCSTIKFSYSQAFHKDYVDVDEIIKNWPFEKTPFCNNLQDEIDSHILLFSDSDIGRVFNPVDQSLADEINAKYNETHLHSSNVIETNFNMGFGEGSDRVIQNLEDVGDDSKFSAATLSDVKQPQPFVMSEETNNLNTDETEIGEKTREDQIKQLKRCFSYIQMRDKVRSFFKKTSVELKHDWVKHDKERVDRCDLVNFPFDLYNAADFIEPEPNNFVVQVVQVGQLPVSAAAQNPVTCDPRVTQVSDASPSQCSVDNSLQDDSQPTIKTEYTELTTADLSVPLMQEYAQHNQTLAMESQEQSHNMSMSDENIPIETEIKSVVKIELMEEPEEKEEDVPRETFESCEPIKLEDEQVNNVDYSYNTNDNGAPTLDSELDFQAMYNNTTEKQNIAETYPAQQEIENGTLEKTDQIAHAMNAAGITTASETMTNTTRAHALVNILSQKLRQGAVGQNTTNNYPKSTAINAMALQQALAQILPPPLNQTNATDNNQPTQNPQQVLHIVQGKNPSGSQITLVDNSQQSVINAPNSTPVLHIVQNKSSAAGATSNGAAQQQTNSFGGLSLVDAGLQQGGNQLLHIVNTGSQKNNNAAGQLLKRVNLLTNLTNVQGSNEQKMVQFVCKSADGKSIQLNAPHQRSMVLRLQPIETPNVQATPKPDGPDLSPTSTNSLSGKDSASQQEIKSRSIYEENYAKFIQNSSSKTGTGSEKSTSLPKFNQAFGKPVFQDGSQNQNDMNTNNSHLSVNTKTEPGECQATDNAMNLDHIAQIGSPPLLVRKPTQTSQPQASLVQQLKQTITPMNIQTMHGGVIYTRQIPVNIGGGQTINLITVPSTELVDDSGQKQQSVSGQNEIEPSIIKIVPQNQTGNSEMSSEDGGAPINLSNEANPNPQPQPVLTQMRIKLPMLSKAPQMVSGGRVVRPSFFQIQRNVIGGTNQPVYQQLVLTAAPPLGQQTIRLPQTSRHIKVPTDSQSTAESQMSSSTLEQLREFDMVLEQVKERSSVPPSSSSSSAFSKLHTSSSDTTDGSSASSTSTETTQQVLYSIGNNHQPLNVAYVNRKASVATPTTSTFVRSPDSSGIVDSPTSSTHVHLPHTVTTDSSHNDPPPHTPKPKVSTKSKSRPKASSNPPNNLKLNTVPPKTSAQKPLEDEQTTQRILYILAEYKEQVENSPDKDKPAPRRRSNPPSNPSGSSKRKKSSSGSRRHGRDMSPIHGEDTCRTMGSEDSSCGTSQGDCNESCLESHSPQDSPRKVVRKLTFEQESPAPTPRPQPQRNVIVADGQTITVARGTAGKPATAVLMPANYILPVSMVKGGQQIAIVTNRGPKLLTVGGGDGGATNALLLQRLIGPAGLKPVLTRPGVRHVRLPTTALHNLQAFNLATTIQPPDSTASPAPAPTPPELLDTRATSSPWADQDCTDVKPERGSSPEGSEPWHLPSSGDPHDYSYEETVRADNLDRTVLDPIPDRYSPDVEAQRIFDKMFDVESKKSYMGESPRCAYDIDASDCDDKPYHQVVQKKDGSSHRQHRLTHVSAAALRHKYAILEHELRLQKSLSEECEDLGVDSPSASELFPEAELLFANSPAHDHTQDHGHHSHTPQPTILNQSGIPQPDMDDQIATDQLLTRDMHEDQQDLNLGLEDVGIVTVSEDGMQATIALDQEEFARSHPNTTFHSEPEEAEVQPFTIAGLKGRHITSTIFHSNRAPATVLMTAPQATVISQATADHHQPSTVKYSDIDNMINSLPSTNGNSINLSSVLVKDEGLTRFDSILNDSRELHLSNTASAIVHSAGNATQVIRRVCYDDDKRDRFLMDEPDGLIAGDDAKMIAEDSSRDATLESMTGDVDDDRSSPERTELFWESNSASERSESRRPLDFSSDSEKCCKSPSYDETNSTDSSGVGTLMRLDSVIKDARGMERSGSADGSSADDTHPPLRTYPPKRIYHPLEEERSLSGKTRAGERVDERSPDSLEVRRRASGRGVVKRGCHCCNGSPAPPRPKKSRQRKPTMDFTSN